MTRGAAKIIDRVEMAVVLPAFVATLLLRVWGIDRHFWLLRDQIRDWGIALGPFWQLPLVGPATHVNGYTIGPAFYWILWTIRVVVGPWFENLPHAGGIGQAVLHSSADALLLVAVWRRTGSVWTALTTLVVVVTAAYDLCFAALVWNPTMGTTLATFGMALVLLDWHRGQAVRAVATAAVAWSAVHAYTGAVFVTVSVLAAMVLDPLIRGERATARRNVLVVAAVVGLLQVPLLVHQVAARFGDPAMDAVTGGLSQILLGKAGTRFTTSWTGYLAAFEFIEAGPWGLRSAAWLLLASTAIAAVRHRRDAALLLVTLLPGPLAIAGYGLFLGALDHYYYLSLMPSAVLTIVMAATSSSWKPLNHVVGMTLLVAAIAIVPARVRFAATMHRLPEYGAMVDGSRVMARRGIPMRAVETEFALPPTSDPEFVYRILGGRIDPASPWIGTIAPDGRVTYRKADGS